MANEQDIIVRIKAEGTGEFIKGLKRAEGAVEDVGDEVETTEKRITSSFKKVGLAIGAAFATAQISAFIKESVRLADIQLKAEAQLLKGLKGREDIQKRLIKQAKELQSTTTFGDEQIIAQQAYLANLEFTEKQIKQIIKASVDLSAGANIPLESSVRNLAKTYSGLSGELGELIPQLRDLTQDQLKNGEGVKVITKLYEGQAAVLRGTGTGAVEAFQNAWGDLREELGRGVIEGVQPLASGLARIAENEAVVGLFKRLGSAIGGIVGTIGAVVSSIGDILSLIPSLRKEIEDLEDVIKPTGQIILESFIDAENGVVGLQGAIGEFSKNISDFTATDLKAVKDFLEDELTLSQNNYNIALADSQDILAEIAQNEGKLYSNTISEIDTRLKGLNKTTEDTTDIIDDLGLSAREIGQLYDSIIASLSQETGDVPIISQILLGDDPAETGDELVKLSVGITERAAKASADARRKFDEDERQGRIAKALDGFEIIDDARSKGFEAFAQFQRAEAQILQNRFDQGLISEKEYQAERAKLQEKEARAQKANAIFETTINIATAISKAFTKGPLIGQILAGVAAAAGVAQLAAIVKTPIPKFAKGTRKVGDGYELGEDRTLAWLNSGERVVTAQDNKKHYGLYNAIEDGDVNAMIKEMASMGVAVQFNAGKLLADELDRPMKTLKQIKGDAKSGIDWNPLLNASERSRRSLRGELMRVNHNLEQMRKDGRKMTRA